MDRSVAIRLLSLVVLGIVTMRFWDSSLLWPLKVLVVLFHELGHAFAAILTGGQVLSIALDPNQGGVTHTRGGFAFLVLNAGYLGSLLAGAVLLHGGRKARTARWMVGALAVLLAVTTVMWVRPVIGFGFLFSAMVTGTMLVITRWRDGVAQAVLRVIGVFSVLYALWDIRSDVLSHRPGVVSDATILADLTRIPAPIWGIFWLMAGLALLWRLRRWLV